MGRRGGWREGEQDLHNISWFQPLFCILSLPFCWLGTSRYKVVTLIIDNNKKKNLKQSHCKLETGRTISRKPLRANSYSILVIKEDFYIRLLFFTPIKCKYYLVTVIYSHKM